MLVLNNLLNGLAVQDIGEIQRDCEVVSAASQVELVAFIESMLLGDPFHVIIACLLNKYYLYAYQSVRSDMHTYAHSSVENLNVNCPHVLYRGFESQLL